MKLQILFGGELAQSVSERVTFLLIENGHEITACLCMSEFKKANPELTTIYIVQTIENEQAPEPATRFFSFIKNKSHPEDLFSKLQYTVIALGDSNLLLDRQVRPISLQYYLILLYSYTHLQFFCRNIRSSTLSYLPHAYISLLTSVSDRQLPERIATLLVKQLIRD